MQKKQIAFILVLLFANFQNCTGGYGPTSRTTSSIETKGNGDGYGGKIKYVNVDTNNTCGGSSKSEIEVTDGTAGVITKENCQTIIPRPVDISALGLMPHDPAHLIFNQSLYQIISQTSQSILLCRANSLSITGTENYVLDAIVKKTADGNLIGHVYLGIYDLNMTLKRTISHEQPIGIKPGPANSRMWTSASGSSAFTLQLNDGPNAPYGTAFVTVPDPSGDAGAITVLVPNVSCNLP